MLPLIPVWLLIAILLITIWFTNFCYKNVYLKRSRFNFFLILFRSLIFLIIIILAANIKWDRINSVPKKSLIRIFFDNSVSIGFHQSVSRESLLTGYEELLNLLKDFSYDDMAENYVEAFSFGESVLPIDFSPLELKLDESSTNISSVLSLADRTLINEEVNAVILVSDGQTTVGSNPSDKLLNEIPIHTIGVGQTMRMVDVLISKVDVPNVIIKGETVVAQATIESFGEINQRVNVSFESDGRLLGTRTISPQGDGSRQVIRFQFEVDEIGTKNYEIRASSLKDEINIENNLFSFSLTVLKDRFAIAILTGAPSFNSRFLKLAISNEENIGVEHFNIGPDGWEPSIANFWRKNYDLIILDNFPTENTAQRWSLDLDKKLERDNSALALIAGTSMDKSKLFGFLQALGIQILIDEGENLGRLPVEYLLSEGNPIPFSKIDSKSLPPLTPYLFIEPGQEGMEVIAQLSGVSPIPLLIVGTVKGSKERKHPLRRAIFTSSNLWNLYFRGDRGQKNIEILNYWRDLLKWLTATTGYDDRYFRIAKSLFNRGEEVSIEGSFLRLSEEEKNAGIWWRVEYSDGELLVPLEYDEKEEKWTGSFIAAEPGLHRYWTLVGNETFEGKEPHGYFRVEQGMIELKNVYLNKEILLGLSESSGGKYFPWSDRNKIIEDLSITKGKRFYSYTINFSHWPPLLVLIVLFLTVEWAIRRSRGLQ